MGTNEELRAETPWGRGDENEKKEGPEEVARIRAKIAEGGKRRERPTKSYRETLIKEVLEPIRQATIEDFCVAFMRLKEGTFTKTYTIGPDNYIQLEAKSGPLELLRCAPSPRIEIIEERIGGDKTTRQIYFYFRPQDLREAAREVSEKHPYMVFEFPKSPARDMITYTVKLEKK